MDEGLRHMRSVREIYKEAKVGRTLGYTTTELDVLLHSDYQVETAFFAST